MKNILLFGAGKSATVLIEYLKRITIQRNWTATIADANYNQIAIKTEQHSQLTAVEIDINDAVKRGELISNADIVISLMPPSLHILIAKDCLRHKKKLLTASYIDAATKELANEVQSNDLLFLYEMGLDPGIDHMSAMQLINKLKENGETITKFLSHCGGLVATESDNNPFHYKISWNPRNVVMAGKDGAIFLEDGQLTQLNYEQLFSQLKTVVTPTNEVFGFYPNRDSLSYINKYNIPTVSNFIRTTLRHPNFLIGWKMFLSLKLTNEEKVYDTNGMSLKMFFEAHFKANSIPNNKEDVGFTQLEFLGLNDDETIINKGLCSAADVMQFALESKLPLLANDKDRVVMLHEIETVKNGVVKQYQSFLDLNGDNNVHTAMAKTVGLPLGIAATLILDNIITIKGLQIPVMPEIYHPLLQALESEGIIFKEFEQQKK